MKSRTTDSNMSLRIELWFGLLIFIMSAFVIRLFYIQILRHDYYQNAALSGQLKQYEIPAERGIIEAHSSGGYAPLVMNETLYTLFADPKIITDIRQTAHKIQELIGGNAADYQKAMEKPTRYSVLAKKINKQQKVSIDNLKLKGIGTRDTEQRTYPQGQLAAQLLGFVNDEGVGKYGLEQALNETLTGVPGKLKAITDAQGVPLASNQDNIQISPKDGSKIILTIDLGMQQQLEDILKQGLDAANSKSGSALIIDPDTGSIKAMANYPTYNPNEFYKVTDSNLFTNSIVSSQLEPGSTMKSLTMAAAMDLGVVNKGTTYFDPGIFHIDDATVTTPLINGSATRSMKDILQMSLNTGATWLVMQMGGGQLNEKGRVAWHKYMTDHYRFDKKTGIEQGYEQSGDVPSPTEGYGLNVQYSNTAFGQGVSLTLMQLASAFSSIINGGTYYQPHLVEKTVDGTGTETLTQIRALTRNVISKSVSNDMKEMLNNVVEKNHVGYGQPSLRPEFMLGGKTGTAQIADPKGGYYKSKTIGTYTGYVGGDNPQYVIVVRVNEPNIIGYAGAKTAAPIFFNLANMLIDSYGVTPKTH